MSRCIRKVENESFYIIYCNTSESLIPIMFSSAEACNLYLEKCYLKQPFDHYCRQEQGVVGIIDLNEILNRR